MPYALARESNFQKMRPTGLLRGFYVPVAQYDAPAEAVFSGRNTGLAYVLKLEQGSYSDGSKAAFQIAKFVSDQVKCAERWMAWVFNPSAASDVDSLTEMVESVIDYITEFGPQAINLSNLSVSDVNCEHLASLLRATSIWKNEIAGWDAALCVAKDASELAGLDAGDVLFGMI